MIAPLVICIILLVLGRDELDGRWGWGIFAVLALGGLASYLLHLHWAMAMTVPLVLIDIALILRIYGGDLSLRG